MDKYNATVVIRSAGERTTQACQKIVSKQISNENIHVINEVPFEAAIKKCYQIGIGSGKKWLITIDADILPLQNTIHELLLRSKSMDDNVLMFNGVLFDKFLLKYRKGGIKVYRIKYLKEAINYIPENGTQIRPESYTLNEMVKKGLTKHYTDVVTGIHDFEQYYCDIYRTCYVHAVKHPEIFNLLKKLQTLSDKDNDYKVAIKGALDGYLNSNDAKIDKRVFEDLSKKALKDLGLKEKNKMSIENIYGYVEEVLDKAGPYSKKTYLSLVKQQIRERGILKGFQFISGDLVERIGRKLKVTA